MMIASKKPGKQRKARFRAPLHQRNRLMSAMLSRDLREEHGRRSLPVRLGDTVKVMRGKYAGSEGKVLAVDRKKYTIAVEGVVSVKADGTEVARPIHPSNVMITKLNLEDKERREMLERGGR